MNSSPLLPIQFSSRLRRRRISDHRRPNLTCKNLLNRHVPHRKPAPPDPPLPDPFLSSPSPTPLPLHSLPASLLHHPHQPIFFPPSTSPRQIPIPHPPLHRHRLHIPIPTLLAHRISRCLHLINGKRHRPPLKGKG